MQLALPRLRVAVGHALTSGILLLVLVVHLPVMALLTRPLYGDAPRNLHWGILTAEAPQFLWDQPDPYERIKGFAPSPENLAPRGLYARVVGPLHPWWGPVAPVLLAIVWSITHSYT